MIRTWVEILRCPRFSIRYFYSSSRIKDPFTERVSLNGFLILSNLVIGISFYFRYCLSNKKNHYRPKKHQYFLIWLLVFDYRVFEIFLEFTVFFKSKKFIFKIGWDIFLNPSFIIFGTYLHLV